MNTLLFWIYLFNNLFRPLGLTSYLLLAPPPQAQLVVLSAQIAWSENVEAALTTISGGSDMSPMQEVQSNVEATLNVLADTVLMEQPPLRRRKLEHLVRWKDLLSLWGSGSQYDCCRDRIPLSPPLPPRSQSWCTRGM